MRRRRNNKQSPDERTITHRRLPRWGGETSSDGITAQPLQRRERGACSSNIGEVLRRETRPSVIRVCFLPPLSHCWRRGARAGLELLHPLSSQARRSGL